MSARQRGFAADERARLLALKGVGATVIARLEQIGFSSFAQLADEDAAVVTKQVSQLIGSTCWHNSPQARAAIQAVIDLARAQGTGGADPAP
ncbi:MAG TPA: helix-hairpin-helix domain-containing protein [Ideonella sp.]|uniref:helix-hairpin-helix domain-containing protein n=1 Tax=Ideonella sp. TaxID=1929293 RepID=UPI002E3326AC|nr:helix-hairpin-helix domain-containing protein [Ideonella sp.]HEX5683022.1 helix-hairpin-helix domain-containing protein [Ideonella sp.]